MKSILSIRILQTTQKQTIWKSLARFSSQPEPARNEDVAFRTTEQDPANHNLSHVGMFYEIPNKIALQQLFHFGGFPRPFLQQCKTFTETCLMIRKPALEMIHYLKTADYQNPIQKYVVYGKPGLGKSISLAHVLHYSSINDWMILHVPWVGDWLRHSRIEVANSTIKPGYVDLPALACIWLQHFRTQNLPLIEKLDLKLQNNYEWNKREISKTGSSILELIDFGLSRVKYSSEVIVALLKEIKQHSVDGKMKTLVAIDGYNAFFHEKTRVKSEDKALMPPWKISFIEEFLNITKADWNNGAAILICDEMSVPGHDKSPLPLYQLTKKGFEHIDPFIPILVSEMTEKEIYSMLRYYKDRLWLQNTRGDQELAFLCGGNGYKLMQLCGPL